MNNRRGQLKEGLVFLIIICPFMAYLSGLINADFWYDEVFTLENYVFVPIATIATDYSFPNNHILFNLINNLYLRSVGMADLFSLMDRPYAIRLLPMLYTLIAMGYLYLIGRKFFNHFVACLALTILVSTVPFYNFALQVRGYGMSMMWICMMLYHLWSFERNPRVLDALLIVLSATLCLYTIPLNLYFIVGIVAVYLAFGARDWRRESAPDERKNFGGWRRYCIEKRYFAVAFLTGIGAILAVLLYLPVIDQVMNNRFVESQGLFHAPILLDTLPRVAYYFVSGRHVIVLAFVVGCFVHAFLGKDKNGETTRKIICCAILFVLPFIFSFIRGDRPQPRVFVNLAPVFALLMAIGIGFLQSGIPALREKKTLIIVLMILYCNVTFAFAMRHIDRRLLSDIEVGRKSQGIYYSYYQAHYYPSRVAKGIAASDEPSIGSWEKVVLYHCDEAAMPAYLRKFAIGFTGHRNLETMLASRERVLVVTAYPNAFKEMVSKEHPGVECRRLNRELQYHNTFLLTAADGN